ncbi:MAG: type II toxin-antitoxin system VapC family toxin [Chloroflexota bacterium]|nr:type II toxin-antitoxin system VapC family toxin [Chloroflexota bacterium]
MTIVLDTSILIDHLRGNAAAQTALERVLDSGERVVGSVLSRTEAFAGMRPGEEAVTTRLMALIEWIPLDEDLADRAGALAQCYLRSYPGIDMVDYAIAALSDALDAELWTRNRKHFPMLDRVLDPADLNQA